MTSARDEIWIDMVQFDVRAADRLWEGIPPAHGAPGWYDDVSGLIVTASGPAEPHELVDEPVVVEDMHKTTLSGPRHCRHGRTLGRAIALKAAAATTASVVGVAAAAAATTGIVATVASVVVPVIKEHVLPADDEQEAAVPVAPRAGDSGGSPDARTDEQPIDPAVAPPATPATPASPQPAEPEPTVASTSPAPTTPTAETAEPAPAAEPAPPRASEPIGVGVDRIGARQAPRVVDPLPAIGPPPADVRPDEGLRRSNERVDAGRCSRHACYGRGPYYGGGKARHRDARAKAVAALMEHARPAHPRRPG